MMHWLFGGILPFIGRVVGPCNADGIPAMDEVSQSAAHFETNAICLAWLGMAMMFPFGEVMPRAVDPANPRKYLAGDL